MQQPDTVYFDGKLLIVDEPNESKIIGLQDVVLAGLIANNIEKAKAEKIASDLALLLKNEDSLAARNQYVRDRVQEYASLFEFTEQGNAVSSLLNAIIAQDGAKEYESAKKLFDV